MLQHKIFHFNIDYSNQIVQIWSTTKSQEGSQRREQTITPSRPLINMETLDFETESSMSTPQIIYRDRATKDYGAQSFM